MHWRSLFALAVATVLTGCGGPPSPMAIQTITSAEIADSNVTETEARLDAMLADEQRINNVFGRLVTSNAELCGEKIVPAFGFKLWSLDDFAPAMQPAAAKAFGLDRRLTVYAVAEGEPADAANVRPGDILKGVENQKLDIGAEGRQQFSEKVASGLIKRGAVRFTFERGRKQRYLKLSALKACPYAVALAAANQPNAATDGTSVFITTGMLSFAADDRDLAVVLGHEIAHAILHHAQRLEQAQKKADEGVRTGAGDVVDGVINTASSVGSAAYEAAGGLASARRNSMAFELDADHLGLYLAARAGYDVSNAAQIWRRLDVAYPATSDGGWTHPSSEERFKAMSATAEEIASKRSAGEPLRPDNLPGS